MNAKKIIIEILVNNNGLEKRCALKGKAYLDAGFLTGTIENSTQFSEAELTLVSAFSFTGCPVAARVTSAKKINPWQETGGAYTGSRVLKSETFLSESSLTSKINHDVISMNLKLNINGELPDLRAVSKPFQESITQSQEIGIFVGAFDLEFETSSGQAILASANTKYELDVSSRYKDVWRNIAIVDSHCNDKFVQTEQIDLFDDEDFAAKDLANKILIEEV